MRKTICLVVLTWVASASAQASPPPTPPPMLSESSGGTGLWPGSGSFGLRIGWGGGTATAGIDIGNFGAKYLINDNIGISVDVGLGLVASKLGSGASFALDGGVMFYVRQPGVSLRPYFPLMVGLGVIGGNPYSTTSNPYYGGFQLAFAAGFGAEFWFSKQFSVAGEVLLRLQMSNFDPVVINFGTLAPGIHGSFYF